MLQPRTRVVVILSTYNGEKYLKELLDSLIAQVGVDLYLLIRDDGSSDSTVEILNEYSSLYKKTDLLLEDNIGCANSYMRLLRLASSLDFEYDYLAYCDQDDVWDPDKLQVAANNLKQSKSDLPCMYFSNVQLVDQNLNKIKSHAIEYLFTFGESLLRNPATGCTVVINRALLNKLVSYYPTMVDMHDSWTYRVCLAVGGSIFFDDKSHIKYRQHDLNVRGGKKGFIRTWSRRYKSFINGNKGTRLETAQNILNGYEEFLSYENKIMLLHLINYKNSFRSKLKTLFNSQFRTVKCEGRLAFIISILLHRY